jgi:DHA1 family 2-module integral membrane pump EmrD-like MFS transporter
MNTKLISTSIMSLLLACAYFFASDMFVPSLPSMAHYFHIGSETARMTIGLFLASLAISQLFYGPASDKYGRKPIILFGSLVYLAGSIVCSYSTNIDTLFIGRAIQGIGAGSLMTLARTIVQDVATKEQFVKIVSLLSIFFLIAPAIAPLIGGVIETYLSWRASFIFMGVFALILTLAICFYLKETHSNRNPKALEITTLSTNYLNIVKNIDFMIVTFAMIAALSGLVVFYTIGPFLLIKHYGLSPMHFGYISVLIVSFSLIARIISSTYLQKHYSANTIIQLGLTMMVISGLSILVTDMLGYDSVTVIIASMCLFAASGSLVAPLSAASALSMFPKISGACGAMYGFLQMGGLFLSSYFASIISATTANLAIILSTLSICAYIALALRKMHIKKRDLSTLPI